LLSASAISRSARRRRLERTTFEVDMIWLVLGLLLVIAAVLLIVGLRSERK
jgi:hypothetical protein